MATVTFDGTRVNSAEATTGWTTDGVAPTLEPDFIYQGTYSISGLVKTTEVGFYYGSTAQNLSTTPSVWISKFIQTNYAAIDGNGLQLRIGSTTGNYHYYYIYTAATYPTTGGWQIVPIDPNVAGYRTGTTGTPNLASVTYWAIRSDCNATAKTQNLAMDAVDYIASGAGLTITGTSGTFSDFVTHDEGTSTNRYGIVITKEGILYVTGVLTIGTVISSAGFSDSNRTIVFPSGRFNTGFCGVDINLSQGATSVTFDTITFIGRGIAGNDGASADSRPDLGITGTSGTASIESSTFTNFRDLTLTSATTITNSTFESCLSMTQSSATITGCNFNSPTVTASNGFLSSNNPALISDCNFVSGGAGHAITLTSTTGSPFAFSGNTFTGYSGTPGSNLVSNTGDTSAAIYNNSGGAITINITDNGTTPSIRNGAGATTTVNNNITVTVTIKNAASVAIPGVEVAIFQDNAARTVVLASTPTNASGEVSTSAAASLGAIIIRARQNTNIATFNTGTGVNTSTDIITTDANHKFQTGDLVTYSRNGGSADIGPEPGTYYINRITDTTLYLYDTAANAITGGGTGRQDLTSTGTETHHLDPLRYIPASATGTIGTGAFSAQITMITDNIAIG